MADKDSFLDRLASASSGNSVKDSIDKNIKKKQKPTLTANEKARLKNEATIFAETLVEVQKKKTPDSIGETSVTDKDTPASITQQKIEKEAKKPKKLKFPLLLALGAGITAFAVWVSDFLGPVGEFVSKTLPKLLKPMGKLAGGFFNAIKGGKLLTMLGSIAKTFGAKLLKFGRFIPVIGSLFSFGFGIKRWKEGDYMKAILEFVSGILNLLPTGVGNIASIIIDGYLLLSDLNEQKEGQEPGLGIGGFDMWGKIKDFALSLPGVKNIISLGKGVGAVLGGKWLEAAGHFNKALPFIGSVLGWLAEAGSAVKTGAGFVLGKAGDFVKSIKDKFVSIFKAIIGNIMEGLKAMVDKFKKLGPAMGAAMKALFPGGKTPQEEFQRVFYAEDFVRFNDGTVVKFDSKDDIIGMKEGGAISKFIKGQAGQGGEGVVVKDVFDKTVATEVQKSNQYLAQLVQLTAQMVTGQPKNVTPIINQPSQTDMSGSMEGPVYRDSRTNFYNSPYSMHTPGITD